MSSKSNKADYDKIFNQLDKNKDGIISVDELKLFFGKSITDKEAEKRAKRLLESTDTNKDNIMNFDEFVEFVKNRETHLKLAFKQMDRNHDNTIDAGEIKATMEELGVKITLEEANKLLARMDKDNNLTIDYNEWRNFLLFSEVKDVHEIMQYWRKSSLIDIGESMTIPDDFSNEEKQTGVAWKTLVSGGVAGCISRSCTAPLDRLKVTLQAHGNKAANHGLVSVLKFMIKEGGVGSLWRGNGVNCLKIAPESAIKFLAYEKYKQLIRQWRGGEVDVQGSVGLAEKFVAGALAGATSQTLIYPMEVLKTRMCLRKSGQYSSIFDCAVKVYRNEGPSVFFRGYVPNILGILPYAGIDLCLFETFKTMYSRMTRTEGENKGAPPIYISLSAGAMSSVCGQVATYPLALVRTKLQAMSKADAKSASMMSTFQHTIKNEGVSGLYRGLGPNMMKVIPAVSISYAVFDQMRAMLSI